MNYTISDKISLLNQTTLDALVLHDSLKIVKLFTEAGIRMLEADFGFAWWQTKGKAGYHLAYKSPGTPYEPNMPRERGGNFKAKKTRSPFFVEKVASKNYEKGFDISSYMRSYVIIPIAYKADIYGSVVLCYERPRAFNGEDRVLASLLGTSAAQSITINDLLRKERETLRARAEQRVRLKEEKRRTEFMSDATHELRTPLAIIKGNIDLALDADRKSVSGSVKTLRIIDREVGNMTRLISDMATLTSQQGPSHKELIFSSVRLRTLIEHSIERCVTLAAKKGITMRAVGLRDAVISGDEGYLDKLFVNLIKNAILYGKKGGHIRVSSSENGRWIHVDVQDDGIGIPEKDLRRIFERLYRTAEAREKDPSGTGLGLAISKWVAEEHGGSVSVTSIKGRGSTFRVTLPKM